MEADVGAHVKLTKACRMKKVSDKFQERSGRTEMSSVLVKNV